MKDWLGTKIVENLEPVHAKIKFDRFWGYEDWEEYLTKDKNLTPLAFK